MASLWCQAVLAVSMLAVAGAAVSGNLFPQAPRDASTPGNKNMKLCNPASTNSLLPTADWEKLQGQWFTVRVSYDQDNAHPAITGQSVLVTNAELKTDKRGKAAAFVVRKVTQQLQNGSCVSQPRICEVVDGDTCAEPYSAVRVRSVLYFPWNVPDGYVIRYTDVYLLASDFKTTAVIMKSMATDAKMAMVFDEIEVWVKADADGNLPHPDQTVVNNALSGFCGGDMANVESKAWYKMDKITCQA